MDAAQYVGQPCPEFPMLVEVGKIREFARATGSANPEYLRGWTPPMPTTFLASASFWMEEENFPLSRVEINFDRILNGAQEFVFHGPPPEAGTRLTGRGRIDKVYEKEGKRGGVMTFVEVVYEYMDDAGRTVAEVRSTLIETAGVVGGAR